MANNINNNMARLSQSRDGQNLENSIMISDDEEQPLPPLSQRRTGTEVVDLTDEGDDIQIVAARSITRPTHAGTTGRLLFAHSQTENIMDRVAGRTPSRIGDISSTGGAASFAGSHLIVAGVPDRARTRAIKNSNHRGARAGRVSNLPGLEQEPIRKADDAARSPNFSSSRATTPQIAPDIANPALPARSLNMDISNSRRVASPTASPKPSPRPRRIRERTLPSTTAPASDADVVTLLGDEDVIQEPEVIMESDNDEAGSQHQSSIVVNMPEVDKPLGNVDTTQSEQQILAVSTATTSNASVPEEPRNGNINTATPSVNKEKKLSSPGPVLPPELGSTGKHLIDQLTTGVPRRSVLPQQSVTVPSSKLLDGPDDVDSSHGQ
ncbi:hypothetical protein P154DRAFT_526093 [Amniculicola lignicola CBS 123094]|uniref:Uncharacterized protein n=1 Tax=Amniculicola lignicola CBS 123094 TaxID=1392246 RepID=A0A6A5W1R8_9PLEO|nr:hypothetical protein P154DRAFT_526093 [Amniculicola lignicola CBS 123094]